MAMTNTDILDTSDSLDPMVWLETNRKLLTIMAVFVVVGGGGWWVYNQSRMTKEVNASKALFLAQQSMESGNPALAKSDLEKLVGRYGGTGAGAEGSMLLAQLDYGDAKYQEGITVLENAAKSAPQPLEAEIRSLLGDGYMSMKNPTAAAREFEKAADLTDRDMERAAHRAAAARAYTAAGDTSKSREIWADLTNNSKNAAIAAEAKVRLGELTATKE